MSAGDRLPCYVTHDHSKLPVRVSWQSFAATSLPQDIKQVRQLCADGCPYYHRNGGCPPWSPTIEELGKEDYITLLVLSTDTVSNQALSVLNGIIDSWMDDLGYAVLDTLGIGFLSAGPCRACPSCSIETGCQRPSRRVSSVTGVGLLLSDILEHHFMQPLRWTGNGQQPKQLTKVMGFLHSVQETVALSEFLRLYVSG